MAHVEKRGANRWRARFRDPDGRERSRTFSRRIDAERWLATVSTDILRGAYIDPSAGQVTFGRYALEWQTIQVHRPSTELLVDRHLRNHLLPFFEHRPIAAVRPTDIQGWVKDRSTVLGPRTVELAYRYLAAIFRAAVEDRLIASSPCRGIKLPRAATEEIVPLQTKQVLALAAAVPDRYRAMVLFAAGTGVRQGEAFGLSVPRLDMLRRTVRIDQQIVWLPRTGAQLGPPKTKASNRTIPLPEVTIDALAAHLAAFPAAGEWDLVFTNPRGEPISRSTFGDIWRGAVRRAGAPEGTGFHDLRHYYASLLIRHGESVKVVQARLGHASATETLDTYSHLWPDAEDRTRLAVDSVLGTTPVEAADGDGVGG